MSRLGARRLGGRALMPNPIVNRRIVLGGATEEEAASLLLDTYTGAAAAYSLQKLRTDYSGSAVRIRRSSDDAEQDIGFSGNDFDTASAESFCGAGDGHVVTRYDQSGNGLDSSQNTANQQPRIVLAGEYLGGIDGNSGRGFNETGATLRDLPTAHDFTVIQWVKILLASNKTSSLSWEGTDDLFIYNNDTGAGAGGPRVFWRDLGGVIISYAGSDLSGDWHLISFTSRASDDHELYEDATSVGTSSATGTAGPFTTHQTLEEVDSGSRDPGANLLFATIYFSPALTDADIADIHSRGK